MDCGRNLAVLSGEAHVAAAQRQAVGLATYRAINNLYREFLQFNHATDYGNLLKILLAEVCTVRRYEAEQLANNLRYTVEMARTHRSFHNGCNLAKVENAGILFGIHLLNRRDEGDINPGSLELCAVSFLGAGIGLKVGSVIELCRIYKDTDHYRIVLGAATVYKRNMSGVEGAHSRHKTDGFTLSLESGNGFFKRVDTSYYFHLISQEFLRVQSYVFFQHLPPKIPKIP
jgi:hypothetical protein